MKTTEERFYEKVIPEPNSGCHLWVATVVKGGYGNFNGKRAHRVAFELAFGPIPPGLFVCHKCDQPACVNPDHLFLGTHRDNVEDMMVKARGRTSKVGLPYGVRVLPSGRAFVQVGFRGTVVCCGTYPTVEEAAAAAVAKKNELYGLTEKGN